MRNKYLKELSYNNCEGTIETCKRCSALECCGIAKEGGTIELPYLTSHDIKQIEYFTGLRKKEFATKKKNPITGNTIFVMKTNGRGCLFFDAGKGRCQIHVFRPVDCRLFPLDVRMRGNKFFWALYLYNYERCNISEKDLSSLLRFGKEALQILGHELIDYATYPVPGMQGIGYKILMKVESL